MAIRKRERRAGMVVATTADGQNWFWSVEGMQFHWHAVVNVLSVVRDGKSVQLVKEPLCFRLAVGYTVGAMAVVRFGDHAIYGEV